jgi:radical SAM superfamily enzyme YgiQ (UPF0313 family)
MASSQNAYEQVRSLPPRKNSGVRIVLTASALEMSDFHLNPFLAFSGGFPLAIPKYILRKMLYPNCHHAEDGTAKFAPYGLRKVEALLIEEFGEANVATVHARDLHDFVGPKTRVVGISTMDPLGIGFVSRTYTGILGLHGKPATRVEFESLLSSSMLREHRPRIIVGGAGAWQIPRANLQDTLNIDTILIGQAEHSIVNTFRKALEGKKLEKVIVAQTPERTEVPAIKKPSLYGTVEITRGCGRGCAFCSPTLRQRYSFSLEHILEEVALNAKSGTRMILLQTDDVFLYEARPDFTPNRKAITELVRSVSQVEDVKYMQIAHASLAPVVFDRKIVEEIAPALVEKSMWCCRGKRCASVEVGIETGSAQLMKTHMRGKALPFEPEQWQDIVVQGIATLNDNDINPLATLILGLPGELEEDAIATIELLDKLKAARIFYVPLLFTSEEESTLKGRRHKASEDLNELQWEILSTCWRRNFDLWAPKLNKIALLSSLAASPYYRLKHGRKILAPIMRFCGWERLIGERAGIECRPQYCVSSPTRSESRKTP